MFLHLKFFKTALICDLKQRWSRQYRCRHRYRRHHRRSGSKVERKMVIVSHGKQEVNRILRSGVLPFVRRRSSFVVIVVFRSAMQSVEK
jgi:hypothetical protein